MDFLNTFLKKVSIKSILIPRRLAPTCKTKYEDFKHKTVEICITD